MWFVWHGSYSGSPYTSCDIEDVLDLLSEISTVFDFKLNRLDN